jgi:hypothetical protein
MFAELKKYKEQDHFFLMLKDDIQEVCNAPSKNGVFVIFSLNNARIEMVYIGSTDSSLEPSGLKNQIMMRAKFLLAKIKEEGAEAVDIYWYATDKDNPKDIESSILEHFVKVNGSVPRWNY